MLADGPDLDPRAVDRVVEDWRTNGGDAVAASYGGVRLHPVLLARALWDDVPDEGAQVAPGPARPLRRPHAAGRRRLPYSSGILRAASFCRSSAGISSVTALRT